MIHTECTCSIPTATTTPSWRRSSPTHRQSTTAPSLMDWNQPPTMWTFMLAQGGLPTGQSSIPALLTPGYRSADSPVLRSRTSFIPDSHFRVWGRVSSSCSRGKEPGSTQKKLFHELGFISVFVLKWMFLFGGGRLNNGRWKDGMCAKEGNQEMFFYCNFFYLVKEDGIMLGACWWTNLDTAVRRCASCSV